MNHQPQKNEHVSTYCVEDRSSKHDLARLQILDQMLTASMGGVLPEQPDRSRVRQMSDVGCGIGGWLMELAHTSADSKMLFGVDISRRMVEYAYTQALDVR